MKSPFGKREHSANLAKERMDQLLVSERIECSPQFSERLKRDLIHTVRRYVGIEEEQAYLSIQYDSQVLHFQVPLNKK